VIPGDIGRVLGIRANGTWHRGPDPWPGRYCSSVPFRLGGPAVAGQLAAALRPLPWIAAAYGTGGYLTAQVTPQALASLAVRISQAGAGCAASNAMRGTTVRLTTASLAAAQSWEQAQRWVTVAATGRLATVAGAKIIYEVVRERPDHRAGSRGSGPVADAVSFAGADAILFALLAQPGRTANIDAQHCVHRQFSNPYFTVCYAHADCASALRLAAGAGVSCGDPAGFQPGALDHPAELQLLDALSWLPERAAAAARSRQPTRFVRYLTGLAVAWLDCRERRSALPWTGQAAPPDPGRAAARLWLADATRTALGTGLRLLGVSAPDRV
jgi:hypothetical protein